MNATSIPKNLYRAATVVAAGALIAAPFIAHDASERQNRVTETAALSSSTGLHAEQLHVYRRIAKVVADHNAVAALIDANTLIAAVHTKVDATSLSSAVADLGDYKKLDSEDVWALTHKTKAETAATAAAAAEFDRVAAEKAAAAAKKAASARKAAALALRAANTPAGARLTARHIAATAYGWGADQFSCLEQLWQKESGWDVHAQNNAFSTSSAHVPEKQAYGIAQSGPGEKMSGTGKDWKTNAATQVRWGLAYIKAGYGLPCGAWAHSVANNWY